MGELASIWIKRNRRGPMDPQTAATAVAGEGLAGNADRGGRRQVTLLSRELWREACDEIAVAVPEEARRANLVLTGVDLVDCRGRRLRIGDVEIRVFGETRPCERMEAACIGLRAALSPRWRAGAHGEVVRGGEIRVGDRAEWIEAQE